MEFRLFFPIVSASDKTFLSTSSVNGSKIIDKKLIERYDMYVCNVNALLKYVTTINNTNDASNSLDGNEHTVERREDVYYVTEPFYGLKYRHGKKLELKIRFQHNGINSRNENIIDGGVVEDSIIDSRSNVGNSCGVERWAKFKLGKKKAKHYVDVVIDKLSKFGYNINGLQSRMTNNPLSLFSQTMTIDKSRNRLVIGDILLEICYLEIQQDVSSNTGNKQHQNSIMNNVADIKIVDNSNQAIDDKDSDVSGKGDDYMPSERRCQWLSISLEHFNSLADIQQVFYSVNHSSDTIHSLLNVILSYNDLLTQHSTDALISRYLLPIVSGYPMFSYYLSTSIKMDEVMKIEQMSTWQLVVHMIKSSL